MRTFFGELICECQSFELVRHPMSSPDTVMEITALYVVCIDCWSAFHELQDRVPLTLPDETEVVAGLLS